MQHPKRRYSFQCLNPDCRRNQTRWVRRGVYVTCGRCGARNPGPATLRRAFPVLAPGTVVVSGAELAAARWGRALACSA